MFWELIQSYFDLGTPVPLWPIKHFEKRWAFLIIIFFPRSLQYFNLLLNCVNWLSWQVNWPVTVGEKELYFHYCKNVVFFLHWLHAKTTNWGLCFHYCHFKNIGRLDPQNEPLWLHEITSWSASIFKTHPLGSLVLVLTDFNILVYIYYVSCKIKLI